MAKWYPRLHAASQKAGNACMAKWYPRLHAATQKLYLAFSLIFDKKRGGSCSLKQVPASQRKRIKTEEKAKVVSTVWGKEFIQFLAALAILHYTVQCRTIFKNRMNWFFFFKSSWCNSSYSSKRPSAKHLAQQGIEQILLLQYSETTTIFLLRG